MKATEIRNWPVAFQPSEWPEGVLNHMHANVFMALFKLRTLSTVPMVPSSLASAHVRHSGASMHSTQGNMRLSTATDMHVKTVSDLLRVMIAADAEQDITGFGMYFDTNTPMFHIDTGRPSRLMWIAFKNAKGEREYLYRENDRVKFYKKLGELLCSH